MEHKELVRIADVVCNPDCKLLEDCADTRKPLHFVCKWSPVFRGVAGLVEDAKKNEAEEIKEWAISERGKLSQKGSRLAVMKPNDAQTQAVIGGKIKAFQQVIDKFFERYGVK